VTQGTQGTQGTPGTPGTPGTQGRIRVGVGGWTYEPWRETFYPPEVKKARELHYASRQLTAIEINGTFYRLQKPAVFAKWRDDTPEGFMFSVKAPRYATYRKVLAEAGEAVERFMASGVPELGERLGPLLWQLEPRHAFEPEDLARFFALLPREAAGRRLRHVLEARHASFKCEEFAELARKHGIGLVFADTDEYPSFADVTSDFVYGRLMRTESSIETGYPKEALDAWAARARLWAEGGEPADLPRIAPPRAPGHARDVFLFFISGAKERAPAAARALIARLS
jgi:uncharacterized protein YecE (DUF72 family)